MDIQEILKTAHQHLDQYQESLERYSEDQFNFKADADTWSLAELYEHISQSNAFFARLVQYCLKQEKGQLGGAKNEVGEKIFAQGTFPPIRIKMPEEFKVTVKEPKAQDAYPPILEQERDRLNTLVEALPNDPGEYAIPHPRLGALNARDWFHMCEMHLAHHLRQKIELEEKAGFTPEAK